MNSKPKRYHLMFTIPFFALFLTIFYVAKGPIGCTDYWTFKTQLGDPLMKALQAGNHEEVFHAFAETGADKKKVLEALAEVDRSLGKIKAYGFSTASSTHGAGGFEAATLTYDVDFQGNQKCQAIVWLNHTEEPGTPALSFMVSRVVFNGDTCWRNTVWVDFRRANNPSGV